ncbi:MAG: GAF domain-containing protein [bacterium]
MPAIAIIPLSFENKVIGCLNVASHKVSEVPNYAHDALEGIAAQIGCEIPG